MRRRGLFARRDSDLYAVAATEETTMDQSYGILSMPGTGFFGMLLIGFLAG